MKKMHKRGKRILVMVLVFAILCTSLPCTPTIPVHVAQTEKNGTWYEVSARINASWGEHITGAITVTPWIRKNSVERTAGSVSFRLYTAAGRAD